MNKDSNSYFSRLLPRIEENSLHKAFRTDSSTQPLCITNASSFIPSYGKWQIKATTWSNSEAMMEAR